MSFRFFLLVVVITILNASANRANIRSRRELSHVEYDHHLPRPHSIHQLHTRPRSARPHPRMRDLSTSETELAPLYPGYGTHFAYIYVGTPPQRQSVIIDTGSHYTAFPCTGCLQCGQHTDQYFNYKNSSTAVVPDCKGNPCVISQSYSEGSSWRAIRVEDVVFVGALTNSLMANPQNYNVTFGFGCQTFETGLFRTQLADGIMGLAMEEDTLPTVLYRKKVTESRIFSLCYRTAGGILTLGGVDQKIHQKAGISYAKLLNSVGWFSVKLLDIQFQDQKGNDNPKSVSAEHSVWSNGKGCIVDSGTTDTYLPSIISGKFTELFQEYTGYAYTQSNIALTSEQLSKIPNIHFTFEGVDGQPFSIVMPWTSYVDNVGGGKFAFRIYLTETNGVVLGANFMNGYNVIFDQDGKRVGFAKANCKYEDYWTPGTRSPTSAPTDMDFFDDDSVHHEGPCVPHLLALAPCDAYCDPTSSKYQVAYGNQTYRQTCPAVEGTTNPQVVKPCSVTCKDGTFTRGYSNCPDNPWSQCDKNCKQFRDMPDTEYKGSGQCKRKREIRDCYTSLCAYEDGDYLIYMDLRVAIEPRIWSYVYTEVFYEAFSIMFDVPASSVELLNDPTSQPYREAKLNFQIRLQAKNYKSLAALSEAAEVIPDIADEPSFSSDMINALEKASRKLDHLDHSRFGWMPDNSIEVLNAAAVPVGEARDPIVFPENTYTLGGHSIRTNFDLLLVGIALGCILMLSCMCYLHASLRAEYARLEKDKSSGGLFKFFGKNLGMRQSREGGRRLNNLFSGWGRSSDYKAVEMMETINDDDDLDGEEGMFDHPN